MSGEDRGAAELPRDPAAERREWARALVATWPPMTPEQVATVARLLGGRSEDE